MNPKQVLSETGEGFGVYDTKDKCWMGTKDKALVYIEEDVAKIAAMMMAVQLQIPAGRLRAMPFDPTALKKKDERTIKVTAEEALRRLEEGRLS